MKLIVTTPMADPVTAAVAVVLFMPLVDMDTDPSFAATIAAVKSEEVEVLWYISTSGSKLTSSTHTLSA